MHGFDELIEHCTHFTLDALNATHEKLWDALQTSGATPLVKGLQMVQLQKAIFAVGMFSIFDAILQDGLSCDDGFRRAAEVLQCRGDHALKQRLGDLQLAINVLKHGRGRSYETLAAKAGALPFRVKLPDEAFFYEGDVSEVSTLVEVDDEFVKYCAGVIRDVSIAVAASRTT